MAGWRLSALLHWGPTFSDCPCFAVVIAKRRCALVSASSIDKGKAYLSHLGGISHNKNAEVYWIRQTASHLSYLSPALLGFWRVCFLSKRLEEFFWQVKFVFCATVQRVKAFGWIMCARWTPCVCCYGTKGVLLWKSADLVMHRGMSPGVFICNNRSLKLLFAGNSCSYCAL